jgi:hypothetical protein
MKFESNIPQKRHNAELSQIYQHDDILRTKENRLQNTRFLEIRQRKTL